MEKIDVFFEKLLDLIFKQWTALSIAIENTEDAENILLDLKKSLLSFFLKKKDFEQYELEDLFILFFETRLSTILEDNSEVCVSRLIKNAFDIPCEERKIFLEKIQINK